MFKDEHKELLAMRARRSARERMPSIMGEPDDTSRHVVKMFLERLNRQMTYLFDGVLPKLKIAGDEATVNEFYESKRDGLFKELSDEIFKIMIADDEEMKRRAQMAFARFKNIYEPEYRGKRYKWDDVLESDIEGVDEKFKIIEKFEGPNWAKDWVEGGLDAIDEHLVERYGDGFPFEFWFRGQVGREAVYWRPTIILRIRLPKT